MKIYRWLLGGIWYRAQNLYGRYPEWIRPYDRDERHEVYGREEYPYRIWTSKRTSTENPEYVIQLLKQI